MDNIHNVKKGLVLNRLIKWSNSLETEWPIYPHGFEESIRNGPVSYIEKNCPHMIVVFMQAGELCYRCNQAPEILVDTGSVLVIPINSDYSFSTTQSQYYHKLVLEIRGSLVSSICNVLHLGQPQLLKPLDVEIEQELREFENMLSSGSSKAMHAALSLLYGFLVRLSLLSDPTPDNEHKLLSRAKFKLENEISKPLNMTALARELGICKSLLNRIFRQEQMMSPLQYHIQMKTNEAKRLLSHTNLSIKEIALRVGYVNQLYFSNAFKKKCGISPSQFRKENHKLS